MNDAGQTILIVEDDKNTAALIATYLSKEGFEVREEYDGLSGLRWAREKQPDLVVLDLMLPEIDGLEVCRRLRSESDIPILMLTAREEEIDRVLGFSLGADDYVVKPFSPRELVERVKAILRRARPRSEGSGVLSCCGLDLDPDRLKVQLDGTPVNLTTSEFKLLYALMSAPGKVHSRKKLLRYFYQTDEAVIERVIDVHVNKLRQKIETDPAKPFYVETVRGFGYRFTEEQERP